MTSKAPPRAASPNAVAVLVAAGRSTRMGGSERKPFLRIGGATVLEHTCAAFAAVEAVRSIVVVAHTSDIARVQELAQMSHALRKVVAVVAGGEQRTDSVRAGVSAAPAGAEIVLVHDAARALIEPATIERAIETAQRDGAALVAVPVRDTIQLAPDGTHATEALDRSKLWAAQTPQAFALARFREVLTRAEREGVSATDDAALWERYVGPVTLVRGADTNLKITTPEDLAIAAALLELRKERR